MVTLYKRNAQGKPLVWSIENKPGYLEIKYGLVGKILHTETVKITAKNVDELISRTKAKRKEGYKELSELKDGATLKEESFGNIVEYDNSQSKILINFLETYLPKYSTTSEGFVLPMLAKVLEDNKPFEKYGTMLGQWKINGLRCIIGATDKAGDIFNPITLTYHSRTGEDWTTKMCWMDEVLIPKISKELISMMIDEGVCLDGELYLPGYSVNDINSFVKNTQLAQHYKLQYWCYDICIENMSAEARRNLRFDNIKWKYENAFDIHSKEEHLNNKEQLIILQSWDIESITDAIEYRNNFIDLGFEGLILRNPSAEYQFGKRNQAMFKFKKIDDGQFTIVDIIPEHKRADLPIFVCRNDINDELFECSINKPQDEQRGYLANKEKYIGKYLFVEYRERSGINQLPFHARGIYIDMN